MGERMYPRQRRATPRDELPGTELQQAAIHCAPHPSRVIAARPPPPTRPPELQLQSLHRPDALCAIVTLAIDQDSVESALTMSSRSARLAPLTRSTCPRADEQLGIASGRSDSERCRRRHDWYAPGAIAHPARAWASAFRQSRSQREAVAWCRECPVRRKAALWLLPCAAGQHERVVMVGRLAVPTAGS